MDTTNYDTLRSLKDLRYSDHDVLTLRSGKDLVATSRQELELISARLDELMDGEGLIAAQENLVELQNSLAEKERLIDAFIGHHDRARESMRRALAAYEELPERLVDAHTEIWVRSEKRLFVDDHYVTPDAYLTALREQANREREAAAAAALKTMNAEVAAHTQSLKDETGRFREEPAGSTHPGSVSGSVAVGGVGAGVAGARVVGGDRRGLFGAIAPQGGSGAGSGGVGVYRRPPAFGPGSRMEPINDPDALRHLDLYKTPLNPKMSSDGPIGGYLPAQVTDGTDPRWSSEAGRSALPSSRASLSAGILGGVSGVVAAGSARSLVGQGQGVDVGHRSGVGAGPVFGAGRAGGGLSTATSMSSVSSSTPSVGVARSFGVPGVGGFGAPVGGSGTMNAAASTSSAGSAASTASSGGVGGLRPFAPSGAGTPGAATTATAGVPGVPGAYGPGAAGVSSDRKDGKSRVGYQVVRVRDDERRPVRLSEGAGPGDVASMKPLRFDDDTDDSWE